MPSRRKYTYQSVIDALKRHQEAGRLTEVSSTWTGSGQVRIDVTNKDGRSRRCTLDEAHALLFGINGQLGKESDKQGINDDRFQQREDFLHD